jgi:ribosomal protein S27E
MMGQLKGSNACDNLNHRRAQVSVRHCPSCGGVVNERVGTRQCSDAQHAAARRQRTVFCVDCGTQLISPR